MTPPLLPTVVIPGARRSGTTALDHAGTELGLRPRAGSPPRRSCDGRPPTIRRLPTPVGRQIDGWSSDSGGRQPPLATELMSDVRDRLANDRADVAALLGWDRFATGAAS